MSKRFFVRVGIPLIGMGTVGSAFSAVPTSVTELASSVNFAEVGTGILAVAGVVITVYVIWKGANFVLRAVKGA